MADGSMVALPSGLLTSPKVGPHEVYLYALIQHHTHVVGDIFGLTPEDIATAHGFPRTWGTDAWRDLCAAGWAAPGGRSRMMLHVFTRCSA